jgi:hypothetical protein
MTATTSAVEAYEKAKELGLPSLPMPGTYYDGYEWMEALDEVGAPGAQWAVVPSWGADGWDLGSWPLVVVAVTRRPAAGELPDVWASVVYIEGDLELRVANARAEWEEQIARTAHFYWSLGQARGPKDLPTEFEQCPPEYRRPFYGGGFPTPEETP